MNSRKDPKGIAQQRLMFEKHLASIEYGVPLRSRDMRDYLDDLRYVYPEIQRLWEAWLTCAKANQNL
ncbi:hypothetical protein J3U75_02480 [Snodgrassella sp. B3088]|uniref:hypothetical protein n=1 Tax=Snodgrassella sp. B3088 TaxID=2818038 RepID=UPI00226AABF1|nr:hypothetical protein [Snodgrassella sp. B3088]MCX8748250.1 hypothetical protein [Snodgrassella sp. B3088]